jgi:hypothetical protein
MDRLTILPDELLLDIIERVHATSPATLPNIGSTSKTLQRLARPLQWKHVVLPWKLNKRSPIARFNEAHFGNKDIVSIRLQPQRSVMNAFRIGMKNANDHLDALCNCLGNLSNLTAFSIFLDDLVDSRCTLPGPVLTKIVRALPPSLLHLEIDTEGVDRIAGHERPAQPVEPADHLCLVISDRVPHLESLRLRLSCLCTELFRSLSQVGSTSKLRRAYIRLDNSPVKESHLMIPVFVTDCGLSGLAGPGPRDRVAGEPHRARNALTIQKLMTHLLNRHEAGAFPQLERFILWKWLEPDLSTAEDTYIRVRDVATRSITRYPKKLMQFANIIPDLGDMYYETIHMVRDHNDENWLGNRKHLEAALLHEVSWMEATNGVRLPPTSKLDDKETRLCTDGLQSWEATKAKHDKRRRNGGTPEGLPDVTAFASTKVLVDYPSVSPEAVD